MSKSQEERKRKRNQVVVGVILIFIMFGSVLGYAFLVNTGEDEKSGIMGNIEGIRSKA